MSEKDKNQAPGSEEAGRTFTEELEVAGDQLVSKVRELIQRGNIRRLIIRNSEGRVYLEVPLTVGVVAGGVLIWFAPVLSALGAIGALLARVRIEIVRDAEDGAVSEASLDTGVIYDEAKHTVESLADTARRTVDQVQERVREASEDAKDAVDEAADDLKKGARTVKADADKAVDDAKKAAKDAADDLRDSAN